MINSRLQVDYSTDSSESSLSLGSSVREVMDEKIVPMIRKNEPVFLLWQQLIPDELCEHCRIVEISGGQIKVEVDSPSHCYTLKLLSGELLEGIRQSCPSARIKSIRFMPVQGL